MWAGTEGTEEVYFKGDGREGREERRDGKGRVGNSLQKSR